MTVDVQFSIGRSSSWSVVYLTNSRCELGWRDGWRRELVNGAGAKCRALQTCSAVGCMNKPIGGFCFPGLKKTWKNDLGKIRNGCGRFRRKATSIPLVWKYEIAENFAVGWTVVSKCACLEEDSVMAGYSKGRCNNSGQMSKREGEWEYLIRWETEVKTRSRL